MKNYTKNCIKCGVSIEQAKLEGKLRGTLCNHCDYIKRKEYFRERAEQRKISGYYKDKPQSKDSVKAKQYYEKRCYVCGYNNEPGILEVHHKDKNIKNHNIENLLVLCPNCHQLIHYKEKTGRYAQTSFKSH